MLPTQLIPAYFSPMLSQPMDLVTGKVTVGLA